MQDLLGSPVSVGVILLVVFLLDLTAYVRTLRMERMMRRSPWFWACESSEGDAWWARLKKKGKRMVAREWTGGQLVPFPEAASNHVLAYRSDRSEKRRAVAGRARYNPARERGA